MLKVECWLVSFNAFQRLQAIARTSPPPPKSSSDNTVTFDAILTGRRTPTGPCVFQAPFFLRGRFFLFSPYNRAFSLFITFIDIHQDLTHQRRKNLPLPNRKGAQQMGVKRNSSRYRFYLYLLFVYLCVLADIWFLFQMHRRRKKTSFSITE